jgi:iron(III) transport system permease protein
VTGISRTRTLIVGAAVLVFGVACILPIAFMLTTTLGNVSLGVLLLDGRQRALLYNSALLAAASSGLATVIGVPLGFGLARIPWTYKTAVRIALAAPILLPPYTVALAWVYISGGTGAASSLLRRDWFSGWTYSLTGAATVLALVYYPLVMLVTEAALRQMDPCLEEAGLLAASPRRVLARITVPLVAPSIAGAALLVFVLALSEFGVPALLRVRVYTTEVFTAFAALFDFARATALMVPLLVLAGATSAIAASLLGGRVVAGQRRTSAAIDAIHFRGWARPTIGLGLISFALALVLPVLVLLRESGSILAAARGSWPSIRISLLLAAIGATLVVPVGATLGYARARASPRVGGFADVLWIVLFAVPSTIVGVALIGLWNRTGPVGLVYGTLAMLVFAYLARFLPLAALIVATSVRQVPVNHEEAAFVAGAKWPRTMGAVVLPQIARGLAAAWVIAFVFAFGELGASILVSPPGESTLPIRIYTIIANTPSSVVAALALLQLTVILVPLAAGAAYAARREDR